MAGIDKMYIKNYYEYDDLLRWSLIYYPKLITYFYDIHLTYKDFEENRKQFVSDTKRRLQKEVEIKLDGNPNLSVDEATIKIRNYYQKTFNISIIQCQEEATDLLNKLHMTNEELENLYSYPVISTPLEVDSYLKWCCPLPCVRRYLFTYCGVNPKFEWLYKLFWKGKKEYLL